MALAQNRKRDCRSIVGVHGRGSSAFSAFSLIEVLVVIGIIAVLLSIMLPAINRAREQAKMIKCLAQMKQLGYALTMYTGDYKGWLPSSDTCGPLAPQNFVDPFGHAIFPSVSATQTWVGWVDSGPTETALKNGTLWPYLRDTSVYRCPSDNNPYHARSYSMNAYLCSGVETPASLFNAFKVYKITSIPNLSKSLTFVEEADPRAATAGSRAQATAWNVGGWLQSAAAADGMDGTRLASSTTWVDMVPSWHAKGCNLAYLDGHAEYYRYADNRTVSLIASNPKWPETYAVTVANPDLQKFRKQVVTWPARR